LRSVSTASIALLFSVILRNALSLSAFIIILHNSKKLSFNADPYRVFQNLIVFQWYWRLVQTPVGGPDIPCNILCENNEMEGFLHYTIPYTCAYIGANFWKNEIPCIFLFYMFYYFPAFGSERLQLMKYSIR
jgi:hypothetical protein